MKEHKQHYEGRDVDNIWREKKEKDFSLRFIELSDIKSPKALSDVNLASEAGVR